MISFPASFILGIAGILRDRKKLLAIAATLISGGLMFFWAYMIRC